LQFGPHHYEDDVTVAVSALSAEKQT